MLQSNEYFSGKVKSIGFSSSSTGRASVGVMVEGEYGNQWRAECVTA